MSNLLFFFFIAKGFINHFVIDIIRENKYLVTFKKIMFISATTLSKVVRHQILSAQKLRFVSHVLLFWDKVPNRTLQQCSQLNKAHDIGSVIGLVMNRRIKH